MMIYKNSGQLIKAKIDDLIYTLVFSNDNILKEQSFDLINKIAQLVNIYPASIHNLYKTLSKKQVLQFTIPAINIRTLTYDTARLIFKLINKYAIGPVIFEIAKSEMSYTEQKPKEYAACIIAAAIKENYQGPLFIQGDHYQLKLSSYLESSGEELQKIKKLIKESITAGFFNIDIDASTLVDLTKKNEKEQQKNNYEATVELTKYIRQIQPNNIAVSIGGEIGHIGGKNSTVEDFKAFMQGYLSKLNNQDKTLSKISVQTGTSHGGIPLPDGTIANVKLDFNVLKNIGQIARHKYGLGGAVQHGASTLPINLFNQFPKNNTLEIHLATGFQNIVYENLPASLRNKIYSWIKKYFKDEWKTGLTEEQFIYKTRKKALGPFKKEIWLLSETEKKLILDKLSRQFELIFSQLNIFNTKHLLEKYV